MPRQEARDILLSGWSTGFLPWPSWRILWADDERDAEVYKRDEADGKLKELEPCLNLRCIEDEVEAMAGNRVKMNF